jgi:hypothetical protein
MKPGPLAKLYSQVCGRTADDGIDESQLGLKLLDASRQKNSKGKNLESKIKFVAHYLATLFRPAANMIPNPFPWL